MKTTTMTDQERIALQREVVAAHIQGENDGDYEFVKSTFAQHDGAYFDCVWRPVPNFVPSEQAMAPVMSLWANLRAMLGDAVRLGELGRGADSDEAANLVIIWNCGIFAATASNEPGCAWGEGRFTPHFPKVVTLLTSVYPPPTTPRRTKA